MLFPYKPSGTPPIWLYQRPCRPRAIILPSSLPPGPPHPLPQLPHHPPPHQLVPGGLVVGQARVFGEGDQAFGLRFVGCHGGPRGTVRRYTRAAAAVHSGMGQHLGRRPVTPPDAATGIGGAAGVRRASEGGRRAAPPCVSRRFTPFLALARARAHGTHARKRGSSEIAPSALPGRDRRFH